MASDAQINRSLTRWRKERARELGISFREDDSLNAGGVEWDGRSIAYHPEAIAKILVHEVNHWRIAAPSRRGLLNYGLASNGYFSMLKRGRALSHHASTFEEQVVSLLDAAVFFDRGMGHTECWEWVFEVWDGLAFTDRGAAAVIDESVFPEMRRALKRAGSVMQSGELYAMRSLVRDHGAGGIQGMSFG